MNITVNGQIRFIGRENKVNSTSDDLVEHSFRILVIETLENSYLAVHCWDESLEKIKGLKVKDLVELECRLESHRNRKNKDLWYHKLLLQ